MKKTYKIILLIGIVIAVTLLAGCTFNFDEYDDEDAIKNGSSNGSYLSSQITTNEGIKWEVKSFGGVKTLKNDLTVGDGTVLDITLEYISGRFKIVAIAGDTLYTLIENNSCEQLPTLLKSGTYTIKAVGDNAEIKMRYKL